jgi:hypothetical protein
MKINWNENPLNSTVEIDDSDREKILLYIQNESYSDILCDLNLWLNREIRKEDEPTIEKIQEKIRPWGEICNMDISHEEVKAYEEYLQMSHGGDCTCWPMTCVKCLAEDALGISTIKGLGKHSASKIMGAFGENGTIDQAIERLEQKPSYQKTEAWKSFTQEDYEKHIPRWENEREAAIKWLKAYKEKHGF